MNILNIRSSGYREPSAGDILRSQQEAAKSHPAQMDGWTSVPGGGYQTKAPTAAELAAEQRRALGGGSDYYSQRMQEQQHYGVPAVIEQPTGGTVVGTGVGTSGGSGTPGGGNINVNLKHGGFTPLPEPAPGSSMSMTTQKKPGPMSMFGQDISGKKGNQSYSGLPEEYRDKILREVVPRLLDSVRNYRSDIDNSTRAASDLYRSMTREAMREGAQGILNNLAGRNIFHGSVADDAMSRGMAYLADQYANKGFESAMASAAMKANEPAMLGQITNLGEYSSAFDDLAPFRLLSDFYLNTQ